MSKSKASSSSGSVAKKEPVAVSPPPQLSQPTVVSLYDIDDLSAHHCGYCNENGNISIGMTSELMRIEDYQDLIDRGWRRSGSYIYKPVMDKTCCPLYTIRCDSSRLELKKSQRKVLKRVKKYLKKNEERKSARNNADETTDEKESTKRPTKEINKQKHSFTKPQQTHARIVMDFILKNDEISDKPPNELLNIPKLKSKHKRLFKKLKSLKKKHLIKEFSDIERCLKRVRKDAGDSIEAYIKFGKGVEPKNKLDVSLVQSWPPSKEFNESLAEEHRVYVRYQTTVHKDSPIECDMRQFQRFLCTSPLMPLSHNGPLLNADTSANFDEQIFGSAKNLGYGSFHQQYRINGTLVAVGVIDILNHCVSSVYFFYDPAYSFLNLGTYSALRELAFIRQLNKVDPNLKYYYLGFYAHNCKKMRYKGQFRPSFLLCPEVYTWHPIEKCIEILEVRKYSRFAPALGSAASSSEPDEDPNCNEDIASVKIRVKFRDSEMRIFKFSEFCAFLNAGYVPLFTQMIYGYCKLFGKKVSQRVVIKF